MNALKDPFTLIGRLLIAYVFIPAGFGKLGAGFAGTVGYIASKGLPMPEALAAAAIVIELGAGLLLLVGFKARWAALALAFFTLVAAIFFHNYWAMPAEQAGMQQIMFGKNLAIVGGLLFIAVFGPGGLSVDGRGAARD
jgi:putative oxidoreductase